MIASSLAQRVRALEAEGRLDLPPIGGGSTAARWRALYELGRHDVAEARIAEAHVDARQILAEAGHPTPGGRLWGVWASEHPRLSVTATVAADGSLTLTGAKGFCGGAGLVDDALVTVTVADDGAEAPRHLLLAVPVDDLDGGRIDTTGWATAALAETSTATVDLTGLVVPADAVVGDHRWYLDRPGFWPGAIGPAACWAGGAAGLVDHALAHPPDDPHGLAHLGALVAARWTMEAVLDRAGHDLDAARRIPSGPAGGDEDGGPTDDGADHRLALVVRHVVDRSGAEIADRFGRALGPRPLVGEVGVVTRLHDLELYRRQCHAERDLESLGTAAT